MWCVIWQRTCRSFRPTIYKITHRVFFKMSTPTGIEPQTLKTKNNVFLIGHKMQLDFRSNFQSKEVRLIVCKIRHSNVLLCSYLKGFNLHTVIFLWWSNLRAIFFRLWKQRYNYIIVDLSSTVVQWFGFHLSFLDTKMWASYRRSVLALLMPVIMEIVMIKHGFSSCRSNKTTVIPY